MKRDQCALIGIAIKQERRAAGRTQAELGKMCDVSADTIGRIEAGDGMVSLETIVRISDALKVPLAKLLDPKKEPRFMKDDKLRAVFIVNLRRLCARQGLSAVSLAKKSDIELSTIRSYFAGVRVPSVKSLKRLADALGVHGGDLFTEPNASALEESKAFTVEASPHSKEDMSKLIDQNNRMTKMLEEFFKQFKK